MDKKGLLKYSFEKATPIIISFIFVGMAYGILMSEAGYSWYLTLLCSTTVYTGAYQFVLITFFSSNVSMITVILTALLMNSRQTFYSISYIDRFNSMGKSKLYMIHTLTDETYAVNYTISQDKIEEKDKNRSMFLVHLFSWTTWWISSVIGCLLGSLIPVSMDGIDFCMTALFVVIITEQIEKATNRIPALIGLVVGVSSLIIFGSQAFMLPALMISSALLVVYNGRAKK